MSEPDDREVCVCFHVSLAKLVNFYRRRRPPVASMFHECHGAGGGCGWCVPHLQKIFEQLEQGQEPNLEMTPEEYRQRRLAYHRTAKPELPPPADANGPLDLDVDQLLDDIPDDIKLD